MNPNIDQKIGVGKKNGRGGGEAKGEEKGRQHITC